MAQRISDLGSSELEVLKCLWDRGPSTVREVLNELHASGRELAYTTVLTFLTRLEQKGYVTSDKSKLAYVYRARVSREKVTRSRLRSLLEDLYDGAAAPLVLEREDLLRGDIGRTRAAVVVTHQIDQLLAYTSGIGYLVGGRLHGPMPANNLSVDDVTTRYRELLASA